MQISTDGANPSLLAYVLRGLAFVIALAILFVLLFMRYQGVFTQTVSVDSQLTDVGDGLNDGADVRYNGLIVGQVTGVRLADGQSGTGGQALRQVDMDILPGQADGIPANVTARTVPSNLFGVNSVELVQPGDPAQQHLESGATIPADRTLETVKLQDAQNQLRTLLNAVPPEQLAAVLGTIADASTVAVRCSACSSGSSTSTSRRSTTSSRPVRRRVSTTSTTRYADWPSRRRNCSTRSAAASSRP